MHESTTTASSPIRHGLRDGLTLFAPVVPFALVLGLAVIESEIPTGLGWASSSIIFGGAAQLTLLTLYGPGAVIGTVVAALAVNARHLMYSAALAPRFSEQPHWFRILGPYLLVDQVFAVVVGRNEDPAWWRRYYLTAGLVMWTMWQISVAVGLFVGPVIPESWGLSFAIPVMFVGLVAFRLDRMPSLVAAVVGGGVALLSAGLPNKVGIILGGLAGVAVATLVDGDKGGSR